MIFYLFFFNTEHICSHSALFPNSERKKKKKKKIKAPPVLHNSINIITSYGSVVLGGKLPGKTALLDESQQRGTTPPDG